jgi:hypothetical protein
VAAARVRFEGEAACRRRLISPLFTVSGTSPMAGIETPATTDNLQGEPAV